MMSFDQVTNNENLKSNPHPLAPASVSGTSDAVDMELLNAFEELQLDDGSDLIVELIDLYLTDAPTRIDAIKAAVARTDATLFKQAAHTLKGSSASLGVRPIAEICQKLEQVDWPDSSRRIEMLVQLLEYKFAKARAIFAEVRQRRLG